MLELFFINNIYIFALLLTEQFSKSCATNTDSETISDKAPRLPRCLAIDKISEWISRLDGDLDRRHFNESAPARQTRTGGTLFSYGGVCLDDIERTIDIADEDASL